MREIIDQLLQGKYMYAQRSLDFSTGRVELSLEPGEVVEGSFTIFGSENAPVYGHVSSTEIRMEVLTGDFSGSPYEVSYRFNARGMSQGDVLKGQFKIISNQGEFVLPFVATVRLDHIASSLGDIKNLFHFANLAKTNWDEAVSLFYSRDFISVFKGNDAQYESLYRGLCMGSDNVQNVEEFLISINKKQPVQFMPDQEELQIDFTGLSHDHGAVGACAPANIDRRAGEALQRKDDYRENENGCHQKSFHMFMSPLPFFSSFQASQGTLLHYTRVNTANGSKMRKNSHSGFSGFRKTASLDFQLVFSRAVGYTQGIECRNLSG